MKKAQYGTTIMLGSKLCTDKMRKMVNNCFDTQTLLGVETKFNYQDQLDGSVLCGEQRITLTFTNFKQKKSRNK